MSVLTIDSRPCWTTGGTLCPVSSEASSLAGVGGASEVVAAAGAAGLGRGAAIFAGVVMAAFAGDVARGFTGTAAEGFAGAAVALAGSAGVSFSGASEGSFAGVDF